jgi:hypothetical protein
MDSTSTSTLPEPTGPEHGSPASAAPTWSDSKTVAPTWSDSKKVAPTPAGSKKAAPRKVPAKEVAPKKARSRPSPAARRFGYAASVLCCVAMLRVIHVEPGWASSPFLTVDAGNVMVGMTVLLIIGIASNTLWLFYDPVWFRAAGDLISCAVSAVFFVGVLMVFPFTIPGSSILRSVLRMLVVVGALGSVIGVFAHTAVLLRSLGGVRQRRS